MHCGISLDRRACVASINLKSTGCPRITPYPYSTPNRSGTWLKSRGITCLHHVAFQPQPPPTTTRPRTSAQVAQHHPTFIFPHPSETPGQRPSPPATFPAPVSPPIRLSRTTILFRKVNRLANTPARCRLDKELVRTRSITRSPRRRLRNSTRTTWHTRLSLLLTKKRKLNSQRRWARAKAL